MTFEWAMDVVLEFEGGYSCDPNDGGGETNFGISINAFPNEDIKNLTKERAIEIYRHAYWDKLKIEMMPEAIRLPFFDCAINQGPGTATIWLQRALGVKADGIIGFQTLAALQLADITKVRKDFIIRRMRGYIEARGWPRFGAGWAMRLLKV
jgi:lysozyme family protein